MVVVFLWQWNWCSMADVVINGEEEETCKTSLWGTYSWHSKELLSVWVDSGPTNETENIWNIL